MKCPSCQGEWTPPKNISLTKCPFCQTDLLQALNAQSGELEPEVILRNLLQIHGTDLLNDAQGLSAMIAKLFAHDKRAKNLLLRSVDENIPLQIAALGDRDQQGVRLKALKQHLQEDAFLHEEAAGQIISYWLAALDLEEPDDSFEIVWEKGFCGFRSFNGTMITEFKYDEAESFKEGLANVKLNGKWGFIDRSGNEVIPLKYDDIQIFFEGFARVCLNGKYGFIDKLGEELISIKYDGAWYFSHGFAPVLLNSKYGFIDIVGNEIIPPKYDELISFSEGFACVKKNGSYCYVNSLGEEISFPFFSIRDAFPFKEGCAMLSLETLPYEESYCFVNKDGAKITSAYNGANFFSEGLANVRLGGEWFPWDYEIRERDVDYWATEDKDSFINIGGLWGYIDQDGNKIIPFVYDHAEPFCNGLAIVSINGKYGFIDKLGNQIISLKYDNVEPFCEDIALVELDHKKGFVNKRGYEIIPLKYDFANSFSDGLAVVGYREVLGFEEIAKPEVIDKNGKIIIPSKYDFIESFDKGLAIVGNKNVLLNSDGYSDFYSYKHGFIDINGNEIIPLKYDEVEPFEQGRAKVKLDGKIGYIDKYDNWIKDI